MSMPAQIFRFAGACVATLLLAASFVSLAVPETALAQARQKANGNSSALGGLGGDSKEPIKIDADKLDVLDKENKAIFTGNVVAVQGDTTVRCTIMTVLYEGRGGQGAAKSGSPAPAAATTSAPAAATTAAPAAGVPNSNDSSIKRILCKGPVTVVSKTQAATSDNAEFDRANNLVIMTGNVALNDGPNITRGEKLTYNTVTGIANVETGKGGRVQGFFVPNAADANKNDAKTGRPAAGSKPATN